MEGIWKNSNLTPLERPQEFTQLTITAADAARLKTQYLAGTGGPNQPDSPGRGLEDRNYEPIRGELRSSQIIDPSDRKIPWNEAYKRKPADSRRTVLNAFDQPEERPAIERCLSSSGAPPMQPNLDRNIYQFVQTPATTAIVSEWGPRCAHYSDEWHALTARDYLVAWRLHRWVGEGHPRHRNQVFRTQQRRSPQRTIHLLCIASDCCN
jgi:hypothetical protein